MLNEITILVDATDLKSQSIIAKMKNISKKIIISLILFSLFVFSTSAQKGFKVSDKNPLDCAYNLIQSEEDLEKWDDEISYIAELFWKSGNRDKAFKVTEKITDSIVKTRTYLKFIEDLDKENNVEKIKEIYLKVYKTGDDEYGINNLWKNDGRYEIIRALSKFGYSEMLIGEVNKLDDAEDRSFALLAISDGFSDNKEFSMSVNLIPQIIENAELSKWKDLELLAKVKAGTIYLKAGKVKEAKMLYDEVLKASGALKKIENIFVNRLWEEIFSGYKSVGRFDDAINILLDYRELKNLNSERFAFSNLVETYLEDNQKEKAVNLLNESFASDNADDWLAEKFLEINDEQAAKNVFYSTKNEYEQQLTAGKIANYYQTKGKTDLAVDILNQAFEKARKIESDEPESGMMSTSPARRKADYMSAIAEKFIELKRYDSAVKVINIIEKPRIKARTFIKLAVAEKSKNSLNLMNQAYLLAKDSKEVLLDADKYEVLNQLALGFSKIGQNVKTVDIFNEILSLEKFTDVDELDDYSLHLLAETGFFYNKSGVGENSKISNSLRKIIKNWKEKDE